MREIPKIVLASASPRRLALLERMGICGPTVLPPGVDESVEAGLPPAEQVRQLSLRKAGAVREKIRGDELVVAADTVVVLDGAVLGKPAGREDARRMLAALSGRRHQVYTGVTVAGPGRALTEHECTVVEFRALAPEEIGRYLDTGEYADKAGAYGIQGVGALLVEGICGDPYNVMGLPVVRLARMLGQFGVDCLCLAAQAAERKKGRA